MASESRVDKLEAIKALELSDDGNVQGIAIASFEQMTKVRYSRPAQETVHSKHAGSAYCDASNLQEACPLGNDMNPSSRIF